MKFEKVSKDKIKITLNYEDLIENNIDRIDLEQNNEK